MEVGSVATPFESRSFGEELALCQRYYTQSGYGEAATLRSHGPGINKLVIFHFPQTMRAVPTCAGTLGASTYTIVGQGNYTNGDYIEARQNVFNYHAPNSHASRRCQAGFKADAEL